MNETLGSYLKDQRERRGMSVVELSRVTRIPRTSLEAIETEHIRKVLSRSDTFEAAARVLGIEPSTLWRKRQRFGL